jgi:hypothetical protein
VGEEDDTLSLFEVVTETQGVVVFTACILIYMIKRDLLGRTSSPYKLYCYSFDTKYPTMMVEPMGPAPKSLLLRLWLIIEQLVIDPYREPSFHVNISSFLCRD